MAGTVRSASPPIAILAVDDEPGVLALVRRCLDDERVTLFEASSGTDALAHFPKGPALDLLICGCSI
jgi:CheY-like chemotaxis protein